MTMKEYMSQWSKENPDWDKDWSHPSTCPASGEVGDWQRQDGKDPSWMERHHEEQGDS